MTSAQQLECAGRPLVRSRWIRCAASEQNAPNGSDNGPSSSQSMNSTDAQSKNPSTAKRARDINDGDTEALETAVSDFADSNIFNLGAVPSPQPSSPLRDAAAVDGESDEAEALLNAARNKGKTSTSSTQSGKPPADETSKKKSSQRSERSKSLAAHTKPGPESSTSEREARPSATKAGQKPPDKAGTGERAADVISPSLRLLNLAGDSRPSGRPEYRPRSPMSLARRRMISTYLPFRWQQELRKRAEEIPEQQFNYLLSTLVIVTSALIGGMTAYAAWPFARDVVIRIFSADAVEARVLQVCFSS
jgi:hypothetical protein